MAMNMNHSLYRRRRLANLWGIATSILAMTLGLTVLLWILFVLFSNGFAALDWNIVSQDTPAPGTEGGGLRNAIVGSLLMVGTTENMLRLVPGSLREAAFALGAPRWKVSLAVTLRAAKSGVITGVLLAIARISGETAPLLFTALNNQFFNDDMSKPMANLPVVIFQFAMSPYDNWIRLAWGGALLITMTVLVLNILARVFFRDKTTS